MVSKPKFSPRLVVIDGQEKGKVIPLIDGTVVIGRSKGDIVIHDPRLSRSHVALEYDKKFGRLTFTDLKSLNGTYLNDELKQEGEIRDGDQLRIGETVFDCQISEPKSKGKSKRKEPALSSDEFTDSLIASRPKKKKKPKEGTHSGKIRSWYGQVPPRRRVQLLLIAAILGCAYLLTDTGVSEADLGNELLAAREMVNKGDLEGGLIKVESLIEQFPESAPAHTLLGDIYFKQKDEAGALSIYQRAAQLPNPPPILHVHLVEIYLRFSMQASSEEDRAYWRSQVKGEFGKLADAIHGAGKSLSTAMAEDGIKPTAYIKQNPEIKDLFVGFAELYIKFKELDGPNEQLIVTGRALQRDIAPDSPIGFKLEALVQLKRNKLEEAVNALEGAYQVAPSDLWVIENLALAKYRLKDYSGTERVVKSWIEVAPDSAKSYLVMSYLKISQKDALGAVPFLQKIIEIGTQNPKEPFYPEALYLVGQVMLQAEKKTEAVQYVKEACRLGYQPSCKSPLLQRIPTSPANREPNQKPSKKATDAPKANPATK